MLRWHVGNIIGRIIESRGLNIKDVAPRAGLSAYYLGQIIKTGVTRTTTLERIAEALGMSAAEIYCELDPKLREKYPTRQQSRSAICPDNNPEHLRLIELLESGLHNGVSPRACEQGMLALIEAVSPLSPTFEGQQSTGRTALPPLRRKRIVR